MYKIIFLSISIIISGCSVKYTDVSDNGRFESYINNEYILRQDMNLSGINLPPGYEKIIDIYTISKKNPGWTGPELITRITLKKGDLVTVKEIHKSTYGVFYGYLASVKIRGYQTPAKGKLIYAKLENINNTKLFQLKKH